MNFIRNFISQVIGIKQVMVFSVGLVWRYVYSPIGLTFLFNYSELELFARKRIKMI